MVLLGSARRASYENDTGFARPGAPLRPVPKTLSCQVEAFTIGVPVWSRTKKRSFGITYPSPATESQRISAFEPKFVNHGAGRGFEIGDPLSARAGCGAASRARP